jgi:hypothetical protein
MQHKNRWVSAISGASCVFDFIPYNGDASTQEYILCLNKFYICRPNLERSEQSDMFGKE